MSISEDLLKLLEALALENALDHDGKASSDAILKKLIGAKPEYRDSIKKLIPIIKDIVNMVSSLNSEEQLKRYEDLKELIPEHVKRGRVEGELPPLPYAKRGNVVTRFAPNPDFVLHLGSLRPLVISYEYAKMYDGKFILRFEDTDPRTKRPEKIYYEMILKDLEWLDIKPDEIYYQSDRLEIYYNVATELIKRGKAYICLCSKEQFSNYVSNEKPCPHRDQSVEKNLTLFNKMLNREFKEGEAVLRIKTDLHHPNPSIRDWPALRIIDTDRYPHPRVGNKYIVWPLYNFSCSVDDHYMGVTHIFRGEEHRVNEEKQRYIYEYMDWTPPVTIHHGKLAVPEGILSKSKILKGIKEGRFKSFDDLRLATLSSLRRRGYRPEALKNIILKVGVKSSTAVIDWTLLAAENRKIIDPISNRYFGVRDPVNILIPLDKDVSVKIRKHPDYPDKGFRTLYLHSRNRFSKVYVDFEDKEKLFVGNKIRLLHLGNFIVENIDENSFILSYLDNDVKKAVKEKYPFIHWVPVDNGIKSLFLYPGKSYRGFVEKDLKDESPGNTVQLERLGYFKIDRLSEDDVILIYIHD